jgi:hypothetical protein
MMLQERTSGGRISGRRLDGVVTPVYGQGRAASSLATDGAFRGSWLALRVMRWAHTLYYVVAFRLRAE